MVAKAKPIALSRRHHFDVGRDGATTVVAVQHKAVDTVAEMLTFHTAGGAVSMGTGLALQAAGFVPNVEQAPATRQTIAAVFIFVPLVGLSWATTLFGGFELDEAASAGVRATLARRWADEEARAAAARRAAAPGAAPTPGGAAPLL